ncbi:MAG: excinuclease ABC subunit UvrA, partial [Flammeovirgaceae bacterium]|nr:excinuclease ABC subunit UvrA [Flammeovirgaceae bacterium]
MSNPTSKLIAFTEATTEEYISVYGARENNLKNINVFIPRNQLVVITGISGSGKSSLAFDTIHAEGQRRYMESFSAYARSFIGEMKRPDVDKIEGLSPVIAIEQKTTSKNPRSTVGTVTEIYDFLRLLYARASEAYSYVTGEKMVKMTEEQIISLIIEKYKGQKIILLAPVVKGRKGHYRELFVEIRRKGFTKVRVDGEIKEITAGMQLDRYKNHDIEIVIDGIIPKAENLERLTQSVRIALEHGNGTIMLCFPERNNIIHLSRMLMCPTSGISYEEPAPNTFSFNSPYGACPDCNGLGIIEVITKESIIPDESLSISQGAIAPLGEYRDIWIFNEIEEILKRHKLSLSIPVKKIPSNVLDAILYGVGPNSHGLEKIGFNGLLLRKLDTTYRFEGVINYLMKNYQESNSEKVQSTLEDYMVSRVCATCGGTRLKKEALYFKIDGKNIVELASMDIRQLSEWFAGLSDRLSERQRKIVTEVLKEINKRIGFLLEVGLDYLTLNRPVKTLSGGESQRIRLATQIGTQLTGVLYILDEPSIGLHQRDNIKLIQALKNLRDLGNSVIVVEHDKDMMLEADYIIDIGPGAGIHGGKIIAQGTPTEFLKQQSPTADFLKGVRKIEVPAKRRTGNQKKLILKGAKGNNLKNITVEFPLGTMICVTGVSGSGKSTLIHETLYPILNHHFFKSHKTPLPFEEVVGLEHLDKVIEVDQSPIGRTPRSNPATYTGVFTDI